MTDAPAHWCCRPPHFTSTCPLCPEYGTRMITHCPGHPIDEDDNRSAVETAALHARFAHPDYEYATTEGPRKSWDDANVPPYDDNGDPDYTWESNDDAGRPGMGWDRFDYTEESYWRRRKPKSAPADGDRRTACPCGHDADHHDAASGCIECRCRLAGAPAELEQLRQRAESAEAALATFALIFEGFGRLLATSSRDWGAYRVDAWLYAVILGWDCEEINHDATCIHGTLEEMADAFGWDATAVAKARRYRAAVRALAEEPRP